MKKKCDCKYNVHHSCFSKWVDERSTANVNCLICSSEGVIILSCSQLIKHYMCRLRCRKFYMFIIRTACWVCIMSVIWELFMFIETRYDNAYDVKYKRSLYDSHYYGDDYGEPNGRIISVIF